MTSKNGKKRTFTGTVSFFDVVDNLYISSTGEEVIPQDFTEKVGHKCCDPDSTVISKITNADLQKTALVVCRKENTSFSEAKQTVSEYYLLASLQS